MAFKIQEMAKFDRINSWNENEIFFPKTSCCVGNQFHDSPHGIVSHNQIKSNEDCGFYTSFAHIESQKKFIGFPKMEFFEIALGYHRPPNLNPTKKKMVKIKKF